MVEAQGRAQIKAELLALAEQYLAGWDSHSTVMEDHTKNYTAKHF